MKHCPTNNLNTGLAVMAIPASLVVLLRFLSNVDISAKRAKYPVLTRG